MSLHLPSRRFLGTAPTILKTLRPTLLKPTLTLLKSQTRPASQIRPPNDNGIQTNSPQKPKALRKSAHGDLEKPKGPKPLVAAMRKRLMATIFESQSIFDEDLKIPRQDDLGDGEDFAETKEPRTAAGASLMAAHIRQHVDPDPKSRRRWQRKLVIRNVTRSLDVRGKETREERIKRTERVAISRSMWLPTSTKKLVHLARQVSGKSLEEARIQMKFSKKKFAKEVLYELNAARDIAVVERGMGLGKFNGEFVPGETESKKVRDVRHGKWVEIDDPTRLYVHEAWVNRGPWRGRKESYRARGRTDIVQMPQANITIRLKEEKTRLREFEERNAKEAKKAPWVQLPNRPITAQRPFYSW